MTISDRRSHPGGGRVDDASTAGRFHAPRGADRGADRRTIAFDSQGHRCTADVVTPATGDPPWPTVVMAHGFGARRTWGLDRFVEGFAAVGMAAVVFDYRHFGASDGTPRRLIDPDRQLADWAAALARARSVSSTDADRIALWGTSFSGGHVLATASREPGVRAVVAQVPFVDGRATVANIVRERSAFDRLRSIGLALADRVASLAGRDPVEVPIASEPGHGGLLDTPGALEGVRRLVPDQEELVNQTPARVMFAIPRYRPGRLVDRIDSPVHVVIAERDRVIPAGPTERLLERLDDPSVHRVPAGHFDVYHEPWVDRILDRQIAFLAGALAIES